MINTPDAHPRRETRSRAEAGVVLRLSAFFAALFLVTGIQLPYLPLWLGSRGFGAQEIATILAAPLLVRVFALPLLAWGSDRLGGGRRVLAAYTWGAVAAFYALNWADAFVTVLLLAVVLGVLWGALLPLTDAAALATRGNYGRMRAWGSIGFVAANVLGGVALDLMPPEGVLWALVAVATLCGLVSLALPPGVPSGLRVPQPALREGLAALARHRIGLIVLAAALGQASHAVFYGFGALHWRGQGMSGGVLGLLWALGIAAEVALFWFSARALSAIGATGLLALGTLAGALRWTLTGFDPPLALLCVAQIAHGLSFGAVHLGAVHALARAAPPGLAGTTQSLLPLTNGVATALATLAAGPLYAAYGGGAYWAMGGLSLAAFLLAAVALRRAAQPQSAGSGGATTLPS